MKKRSLFKVLLALALLPGVFLKLSAQSNIALDATVSTSYISSWETLGAVNDNSSPFNSNDKSSGAYGNWDNPNSIQWVQYDWSSAQTISKTEIYWFDDNGGVLTPTQAYVEYWNGTSWINCGDVPKVKDTWNELTINNITTSRFRISMLNSTQSTGILEWRVLDNGSSTNNSVTIQENTTGFCSVDGTVDNNNAGFTGDGFANTSNALGNGIDYKINASVGTVTLLIQYAGSSDRPANIIVNNSVVVSNLSMPSTGSWTTWSSVSTTFALASGVNDLRIEATTSTGLANVDYITVTGSGVSAADCNGSTTPDTEAPATPNNLNYSSITSSSVNLSWNASSDNVGVTGYQILQNGSAVTTSSNTSVTISGLSAGTTYSFTVKAYDAAGNYSSASSSVSVTTSSSSGGNSYTWPAYNPTISYNFRDEYGDVAQPNNILDDCSGVVGTQSDRWWTFRWGANKNSLVTSAAITPLLNRMNTDFAYFRDEMGWPPDLRAQNGYKSAVYLYGSGLCTDNASNTELGGWQSTVYYDGQNWPIVLASYYPIYCFDPACTYSDKVSQQGAMVHEGIHCVLASMPGVKNAAWFHEGGNTWLQQEADSRRSGNYNSMGFLNAAAMIAPFMPIECYSGWLQDGSFGGPSAEGVNMFDGSQQICTWRTLLGGTQYGNIFPTFMGQALGDGSVAWVWRNCPTRVLEGIAGGIGETQTRRLISEYRAKQAVVDFGVWTNAIVALLNSNMGSSIQAEWQPSWLNPEVWIASPYVKTTNNNGLLTPESRTTPGWSGANQIPLTVSGNSVKVNFRPIGANMTCQIAYIATNGTRVYSELVSSGDCSINLDLAPANNVVIAVVTNTDYIYNGESTRTAHYDYRLQLVEGISGTADVNGKWYQAASLKSTNSIEEYSFNDISKYCSHALYNNGVVGGKHAFESMNSGAEFNMYPNPVERNTMFLLEFNTSNSEQTTVIITNVQGQKVFEEQTTNNSFTVNLNKNLSRGFYFVTVRNSNSETTQKLLVK